MVFASCRGADLVTLRIFLRIIYSNQKRRNNQPQTDVCPRFGLFCSYSGPENKSKSGKVVSFVTMATGPLAKTAFLL